MEFIDYTKLPLGWKNPKEYPFVLKVELDPQEHQYERYFTIPSLSGNLPDISASLRKFLFENFGFSDMVVNGKCSVGTTRQWTYRVEKKDKTATLFLCFKEKNKALEFKLRWL